MTNAIEQAKREMYGALEIFKHFASRPALAGMFESQLEAYLELLRQDHEALHETARKRFEDLQAAEVANQELQEKIQYWRGLNANQRNTIEEMQERLAKMTEERDSIQLRLHAVDHSYRTQQDRLAIPVKDSVDRGSCEAADAKAMAFEGAVIDAQGIVEGWAIGDLKAKKAMRRIAGIVNGPAVHSAMLGLGKAQACMHSFFAIGDDQMKCTFCGVGK